MNIVMSVKRSGYVVATFKFRREGNKWTAFCEELGTSTFGRSIPEAHEKLKEAVLLHLDALEDVFILISQKRARSRYPGLMKNFI